MRDPTPRLTDFTSGGSRLAAVLAAALARVLDDASLREHLRSAGPARAAQFTWDACVDRHVDAYESTVPAGATA